MLDELQRVQIALHDMLSQPDLKKINISKLCLEAGISRRTFYLRYGKINNCIEACILLELKTELRKNEKNSLRQILNSLCSYIQKHKQYFYNGIYYVKAYKPIYQCFIKLSYFHYNYSFDYN